jgi:hypothetical protein
MTLINENKIQSLLMMLSTLAKKNSIKKALKWLFSSFGIFFISMLLFILVHVVFTGESSTTAEYCTKYGFLASPACW